MANEHIDPVYKYVDNKVNILNERLLISSRNLARFIILSTTRQTRDIILRQKPDIDEQTIVQLIADAKSERTKVDDSDNPLLISAKFENKCFELLKSLKIKAVII